MDYKFHSVTVTVFRIYFFSRERKRKNHIAKLNHDIVKQICSKDSQHYENVFYLEEKRQKKHTHTRGKPT